LPISFVLGLSLLPCFKSFAESVILNSFIALCIIEILGNFLKFLTSVQQTRFKGVRGTHFMKNGIRFTFIWLVLLGHSSCFGVNRPTPNPLSSQLQGQGCTVYDEPGVSHAKAHNELGAFACLGYLHGRDRAWQMDFLRRIVEGRKAEVLGYRALKDDLQMRLLGLDQKAKQLFEQMSEEQRAPFWAYAYGVNQGFQTDRAHSAYEFKHYGYQPDEWEPVSSIEVLLLQSFDQTRDTFNHNLDDADWMKHFGAAAQTLFARQGLPWSTTILKEGEYPSVSRAAEQEAGVDQGEAENTLYPLPALDILQRGETGKGSNNWAIAPQRSLTKNAFFANDPHLDLKHPPFWYWAHIEGGTLDAIGATLPGSPMIASGTNRKVAWGLTNSYFDVSELAYVPDEDLKNGTTETFYPWVWIKIGVIKVPFFFKGFQRTKSGHWPVLPVSGGPEGHSLVLRWSGYDAQAGDIDGMLELITAKSSKEADLALSHIGLPSWNFAFADTQGVIGYRTVGKLPKRVHALPFGVPVHSLAQWAPWTFLTADEAPHVLQPARGYVVTANNEQWPSDSVYRDGRAQSPSFRAFRIEELLKQTSKHDRDSLKKIQCDQQAVDARFMVAPVLNVFEAAATHFGGLSPRDSKVLEVLRQWDFAADESCKACGVWTRWIDLLMTQADLNREALYRTVTAAHRDSAFLDAVWNTFHQALDDMKVGSQGELPSWGEVHVNPFLHFSGDPAFAVPPIPTGGVSNSVNPGSSQWDSAHGRYVQTSGASQRLIVELSDPPVVQVILAGSNQDIEKPNLADAEGPWMKWKRCELERKQFPMDWSQVHAQSVAFH